MTLNYKYSHFSNFSFKKKKKKKQKTKKAKVYVTLPNYYVIVNIPSDKNILHKIIKIK
jgi:hypothetical protein